MARSLIVLVAGSVLLFLLTPPGTADITFTEHSIRRGFAAPWFLDSADIDSDGDPDVVASASNGSVLTWWENDDGAAFHEHAVSGNLAFPMGVEAVDLDSDGDIDIICAVDFAGTIEWWENDAAQAFTQHTAADWAGVNFVGTHDVDGDGDVDIVATGCQGDPGEMGWLENDGSQQFIKHIVKSNWDHANSVHAGDLDSDGDVDLIGTASWAGQIAWFENDGNQGFVEHTILNTWARPSCGCITDLDLDGDADILATICQLNQVVWFENDGAQGLTQHVVDGAVHGGHSVCAEDIDGDGDRDILAAAKTSNLIAWWENDGNQGFTRRTISDTFAGASDVQAADVDSDGDLDVFGVATAGSEVAWWESQLYGFGFEGEPTSGHAPLTVQFTDLSNADPPLTYRAWDFDNDGTTDSEDPNPLWTYQVPGNYSVKLEVASDSLERTVLYEDYIRVFDGESALEFDGEDGHVSCGASPDLNTTAALTIEAWISPVGWGEAGSSGYGRIVDKTSFGLYLNGQASTFAPHSLVVYLKTEAGPPSISWTPDSSIVLNRWQHVAVTYDADSSAVRLYIDGCEQPLSQLNAPSGTIDDSSTDELVIGNSTAHSYTFDGIIDEVRIWGVVRSPEEILESMDACLEGTEPGLVGYWQMNEGFGPVIADWSGGGNDGVIQSARWAQGVHRPQTSGEEPRERANLPGILFLGESCPNPFRGSATIRYHVLVDTRCDVMIYDLRGRVVRQLFSGRRQAGAHSVLWDGTGADAAEAASGVYLCCVRTEACTRTRRLVLCR
jgi:PKD repeat protein